jgi:hypothetical protein
VFPTVGRTFLGYRTSTLYDSGPQVWYIGFTYGEWTRVEPWVGRTRRLVVGRRAIA